MCFAVPPITVEAATFDPMAIQGVRHTLSDHPLLQLPALVDLARRLAPRGAVRYHQGRVTPDADFTRAPEQHPINRPPAEIIENIESASAWFSLHDIQIDPVYRQLVFDVLESVRPMVEASDPGMHFRAGWIFVSSPGAITPYHMDHEHNFILQLRGRKRIHVFPALDPRIVSEASLERFHGEGSRELVRYDPAFEASARVFDAGPGDGAFMPTTAPHWVENGAEVSVTASFTWFSEGTRRRRALYQLKHAMRTRGLWTPEVGHRPFLDGVAARTYQRYLAARKTAATLRDTPFHDLDVPFATNPPGSAY